MSRLQISDLSFCETANPNQIQGGLSTYSSFGFDLFPFLSSYFLPDEIGKELENYSSEETEGYVVKEFKDESGDNYTSQATSKDGKRQVSWSIGNVNNLIYVTSSVSSRDST